MSRQVEILLWQAFAVAVYAATYFGIRWLERRAWGGRS